MLFSHTYLTLVSDCKNIIFFLPMQIITYKIAKPILHLHSTFYILHSAHPEFTQSAGKVMAKYTQSSALSIFTVNQIQPQRQLTDNLD